MSDLFDSERQNLDHERKKVYKRIVDALLDQYDALKGRPRSQTHRAAIATSIADAVSDWRHSLAKMAIAALPVAMPIPKGWGRIRITTQKWNGLCRRCKKPAEVGHFVAWDPSSGRPSTWQHVSCENPFAGKG